MSEDKNLHEYCADCRSELIIIETPSEDTKKISAGYHDMANTCELLEIDINELTISFGLCGNCLKSYVISSQISIGGVVDSIYNE